ncbi:HAD family hydrolase [Clostridium sartagoforme AAU1]|uniref:HAD family hydrolase n=1 Tax=Clostridium sartagoforme AAU1 TaxID=1202534 RepID=R9CGV6_9CLOT|nr:Cof-type HAD-IIB family hydrolase [Clostridium sartagoforme]EOR28250.1 HAD family hydrolase [Clostridium sartagoforme AAU1]
MNQKIKLICIDMDGTLLNSNHEISERNKETLRQAKKLGVNIAITTGRLFGSARYYSNLIGIENTPVIASNGAYIKTNYEDIPILENSIPKEIAIEIYKIIKKHNLKINFNSWDTLMREDEVPDDHAYTIMNKQLPEDKKVKFIINSDFISAIESFDGKILKGIVIERENLDNLWAAKDELKEIFGDKLHVVSSGTDNIEIMIGTTSKGNAVAHLADILNVNAEEVMCIGDSENDISMLKFAGIGVAMGNGLQMVKDIADYITDTNDNDGVAKAVEKFILS